MVSEEHRPLPPNRIFALGLAASALAVLPLLTSHHLPLLDAPAHEARLAILRDLLITRLGSPFYDVSTFFVPNIAFDLVGLGLIRWFTPESVGKIFFGMTLILTLWGVIVLNRVAIGRWSTIPIASVLMLFNLVSILGFFSYGFGLALVFWALAARLKLDRASPVVTLPVGSGFGIILLFCHVADFGIYAAMASGFAVAALVRRQQDLVLVLVRVLELLPAVGLYFAMSVSSEGHARYDSPFLQVKLFSIAKAMTSGSIEGDVAFVIGAASLVLLVVFRSRARLVSFMIPGLIALCVIYIALPSQIGSGAYVAARLPVAIALLGMAALDAPIRRSRASTVLIGLLGIAVMAKQGAIEMQWRSFDPQIDALYAALDALPAGSVIIQAECQPEFTDVMGVYRQRQPSMGHLASMASFDDTRFVANTYAIAGQQPIQVAHSYKPYYDLAGSFPASTCTAAGYFMELARIEELEKAELTARHTVPPLYFLLIRPKEPEMLSSDASLIARGLGFELYAIRKP